MSATDSFVSQRFNPALHAVSQFSCGDPDLDRWLKESAANEEARNTARVWVWSDSAEFVLAYFVLAAHRVSREDVQPSVGRGGPQEVPAILLAKLALDSRIQDQHLGAMLVADAAGRALESSRVVAARLLVVDAKSERLAGWYESLGFVRPPGSLKLVQKMSDVAAALDEFS